MFRLTARLPNSRWPIWLLAGCVILGLPATSWLYFPALLRSGSLPPEGDSIGIPLFGSLVAAAALSPVALAVTYGCVRRYRPGAGLFRWRPDRPLVSSGVTVLFGVPAFAVIVELIRLSARPTAAALLWLPYDVVCLAWLVLLHGAALSNDRASTQSKT